MPRLPASVKAATYEDMTAVKGLYSRMGHHEKNVAGGEGLTGIYGSITETGMHAILIVLACNTALGRSSAFVDIGHGLGRPLLHAMAYPGVGRTIGYEVDAVKFAKSVVFADRVLGDIPGLLSRGVARPELRLGSVTQLGTLSPATHIYTFWEGLTLLAKMAIARLFRRSDTVRAIAVVQRAWKAGIDVERKMDETYGFGPVVLLASFQVKMSGSGRGHTAYIFKKPTISFVPWPVQAVDTAEGGADEPDADPDLEPAPTAAELAAQAGPDAISAEAWLQLLAQALPTSGAPASGAAPPPAAAVVAAAALAVATSAATAAVVEQDQERCSGSVLPQLVRRTDGDDTADEQSEDEAFQDVRRAGRKSDELPRDEVARAIARQEHQYRPSRMAPGYEVNALAVVRDAATKRIHAPSYRSRDSHMYVRLKFQGADKTYALRNLVAAEWVDGAYAALQPGLSRDGTQIRGAGMSRIAHHNGDRRDCHASNLAVVSASTALPLRPPPPQAAQAAFEGAAAAGSSGQAAAGVGARGRPRRAAAAAAAAAMVAAAGEAEASGPGGRRRRRWQQQQEQRQPQDYGGEGGSGSSDGEAGGAAVARKRPARAGGAAV